MHLLVATDGSEAADDALAYALDLAAATDGRVTIAHVVQPDVYADAPSEPVSSLGERDRMFVLESIADAEEHGQRVLDEAVEAAADRGVDASTELLYGDPVSELAGFAEREDVDGVVIGHRGLSRRAEELLGSTSKELVARASVPVTVVR